MASDVHETSASGTQGSVQLIDLAEGEQEAPFAVREADGSVGAAPGRMPSRAEILAWLEEHPVVVGVATGVLCFSIIAGAMSTVLGSDSSTDTDDPVAGAALSETEGGQGSFSSSGSGGANFTSDESKLSRTGAGRVVDDPAGGETAAGPSTKSSSPSDRYSQSTSPTTAGASNLDQSATLNGRAPATGNGTGQSAGPGSTSTPSAASGGSTTAGNPATTLNPGPNVSGPVPTTVTTNRVSSSIPVNTNPTTVTTAGQTTSTQSSPPTTPTTAPPTTPTTPAPASLTIVAPADGSSHSFETPTNFAADFIPGATQYCWTFIQSGVTAFTDCTDSTTYQLPARPSGIGPGLVTVRATATGSFGTFTDIIQISLYRSMVINNPTQDLEIGRSPLRIGVVNLIGATQYCFRITQTGYNSGLLCYETPGTTFNPNHPIWDSLSPGPLTVSATIYGGGITMASDSVTINLL